MRQFWVKNAKGQIFDMNRADAFFSDPKNLGIARKTSYEQVGYNWIEKENILSQKKPSGNMVFDGYEQYDEFVEIIQYTPLVLMYQPLDTMYYMDINTFSLEKSEISEKNGFLTCKVTFDGISPWYVETVVARKEDDGTGKVYSYAYPYTYSDASSGEVEFVNHSGMEAYGKLVIYGPVEEPSWRIIQGENIISEGAMFSKIDAEAMLVINSIPQKLGITECDLLGQVISDRYGESDFNTSRFLYLPPGKSKVKVNHAGASTLKFYLEVMEFAG